MKTIAVRSEKMFRENEKMQPVLAYIMANLEEDISLETLSRMLNCSENTLLRRFKKYYGVPCERFIMNLKMRAAAQDMLSGEVTTLKKLAEKYRFSGDSAFSKAFKREIKVSPKAFMRYGKNVPDMPMPKSFNGCKMHFKYMRGEGFDMYGYKVPLVNGVKTDLLKECAYPLEHNSEHLNLYGNKDQIGFWWSDTPDELYYVLGCKMYSRHDVPEDARIFHIERADYAVFSVERSGDLEETLLAHRMMVYYAMMVWRQINKKVANTMVYTYEVFGKNYTYLYLPLWKGMPAESESVLVSTGLDEWISYIDRTILEEKSMEDIAAYFNYSERHFCRVFKNYFAYSVQEYIRKKRLYLAARDLKNARDEKQRKAVVARYHFEDPEAFRKNFQEEFLKDPEEYLEVSFHVPNLSRYYSEHKDQIELRIIDIEEMKMIGKTIQARNPLEDEQENLDIPDLVSYWMRNDPDEIKGTKFESARRGEENKLSLWYTDTATGTNEYILGPLVDTFEDVPEDYKTVTIPAGKYAVIKSLSASDEEIMTDTYRLLARCGYGWIKEFQFRVNLERLTFVHYYEGKLHFYIPVYE